MNTDFEGNHKTRGAIRPRGWIALFIIQTLSTGCSVIATRPIQEMSDAAAALRAAREVKTEVNAPEYHRLAEELFFKARQEYRLKNFSRARKYANQAREAAEKGEFLSIRGGAVRSSLQTPESSPSTETAPTTAPTAQP